MYKSIQHLNGNLLVATDCETTGLVPGWNEVWQVAFIPLNEKLQPSDELPICDLLIKPLHPERIQPNCPGRSKIREAIEHGHDPTVAFELWETWVSRLGIPENKRIVPLCHNWGFEHRYYVEWMGFENFNHYIDTRARDTLTIAQFLMDRADFSGEKIPFAGTRTTLNVVASHFGIETVQSNLHDAVYDSFITAKVYETMLKEHII